MADEHGRIGSTVAGEVPPTREVREQRARDEANVERRLAQSEAKGGALAKVMNLRVVRAFQRYSTTKGVLLAGGIAYTALFSLASALTIAWTVFMATLGSDPGLRTQVIDGVNSALPGLIDDGANDGMIPPSALVLDSALNPASIIAALVLLWSAIGLMTNIRTTVQTQFGIIAPPENFVLRKLRDLAGFLLLAVGIVLTTTVSTAASTLGEMVLGWIGLGDNPVAGFFLRAGGLLLAVLVSALQFVLLFRVTAAVRPLRKDLWMGALIGGVAINVVLTLGTSLVSSASDNPLLASAASLGTLLLWVNLLSQVLMFVAAFTANPPSPEMPKSKAEVHFAETPNFVTLSDPRTLAWDHQDVTGQLDPDPSLRPDAVVDKQHKAEAKARLKDVERAEKKKAKNARKDAAAADAAHESATENTSTTSTTSNAAHPGPYGVDGSHTPGNAGAAR